MLKKYINTAIAVLCASAGLQAQVASLPPAYGSTQKINFVRTWDVTAPGLDANTLAAQPVNAVSQTTQYMDGLGRPVQTVLKQGSLATGGTVADMVSANVYDPLGREPLRYLPFAAGNAGGNTSISDGAFKLNPFEQQAAFMQGQYGTQGETYFYNKTEYEASPMGRTVKVMPPGNNWVGAGRGIESKYCYNTLADEVRIWTVTEGTAGSFGTYTTSGTYPAGELRKSILINENGLQVIEFKDKEGKVILKKIQQSPNAADNGSGRNHVGSLCTYYIYDALGRLRCTLQPNAVDAANQGGWALTSDMLDELSFRYEYDNRHRITMKKAPGAAPVYMVYDMRDRLVLMQDGNMRNTGKWLYTQYDAMNRQTVTGLWTNNQSLATHAAAAANSSSYPATAMLAGTNEELTATYYDDYSWLAAQGNPLPNTYSTAYNSYLLAAGNNWPYPQANLQSAAIKGMVTGSRTKVAGTANTWLYSINFYDSKYRIIQSQSTNITGGTDINTTQYGWAGMPLVTVLTHQKAGTNPQTHIIVTKLEYDNLNRLLTVKKAISSNINGVTVNKPEQLIVQNEYDKAGQLKKKKLGAAGKLESLEFEYNIRGWLLGTNRNYVKGAASANYFGFELGYEKTANIISGQSYATPQYNGNISGTTWKGAGDGEKRKYDFSYDAANRLTGADFNQYTANTFNKTAGLDFSVSNLTYDANGNIKTMTQAGWKIGTGSAPIDQLTYSYQPLTGSGGTVYGNKLLSVTDAVTASTAGNMGDFKDGTNSGSDYSYDANGNLLTDNNKKISDINYNCIDLPQKITVTNKGNIEYVYDAAANKLKKIVHETGKPDKTTLYTTGFVYENDVLQFAPQEEGRIRLAKQYYLNGDSALTWQYDYFLKDHLGNMRTVLTEQTDTAKYMATFETAARPKETALFARVQETAYPIANIHNPAYPADDVTSSNKYTSKLNGTTNQLGATLALKVMAGDKVDIGVKAWVPNAATAPDTRNISPVDLLSGLISALSNSGAGLSGGKATPADLQAVNGSMSNGINVFLNSHNDLVYPSPPRAYLNWVLFDEQFNYVPTGSGFIRVGYYEDRRLQTLANNDLPVVKSGYLFVYLSYERKADGDGPEQPVFFDNLVVQHYTGALTEENTYYPYGLSMAGLSSRAVGRMENKYKFNDGTELNNDFDISLYETDFRSLDPQIGRFWQTDPLADAYHNQSPYAFANGNPILFNDPLGLYSDTSWKVMRDVTVVPVTPVKPTAADPNTSLSPQQNPAQGYVNPPFVITPITPAPVTTPVPEPVTGPGVKPYFAFALSPAAILTTVFTFIPKSVGPEPLTQEQIREELNPAPRPFVGPYTGHGNKKENWNPHIVYQFTYTPTDGRTPILKYGISDYLRYDFDRPERQMPRLISEYGASVKLLIIAHTMGREKALAIEQDYVNKHQKIWNEMPREQINPSPDFMY
jgi:RHS repeat-associated protein